MARPLNPFSPSFGVSPPLLAGAALPELEDRLMTGAAATFLQRCNRHEIGDLAISDAETALRSPIETAGAQIGDEALQLAAEVSDGQPYLIQLIGADMWDECADPVAGIAADDVERALVGSASAVDASLGAVCGYWFQSCSAVRLMALVPPNTIRLLVLRR